MLGRGRKLIGGTVSVEVDRRGVSELLVDGFFPHCRSTDRPARQRASGFREIGLPFESDTAVTRHLAAFLQAHGDEPSKPVRPTHVLFNGGVFKADVLRQRLLDVLGEWFGGGAAPQLLEGEHDLDHAVARGAAYYGWTKQRRRRADSRRHGPVVLRRHRNGRAGRARRPAAAAGAVRRADRHGRRHRSRRAVRRDRTGRGRAGPVPFLQFARCARTTAPATCSAHGRPTSLSETDSLEAMLPADESIDEPYVPVRFHARITELGVLELWCVSTTERQTLEAGVQRAGRGNVLLTLRVRLGCRHNLTRSVRSTLDQPTTIPGW